MNIDMNLQRFFHLDSKSWSNEKIIDFYNSKVKCAF